MQDVEDENKLLENTETKKSIWEEHLKTDESGHSGRFATQDEAHKSITSINDDQDWKLEKVGSNV